MFGSAGNLPCKKFIKLNYMSFNVKKKFSKPHHADAK